MLILLSLFSTMISLITWATPNVIRSIGDEGLRPLSLGQNKTVLNKRYKIYHIWTTIGAIGCIVGLIMAYIACY